MSNVRNHRESVEYMLNIMSHSKNANFHDIFNQLTFAYKKIDVELKQALKTSTPNTTIKEFINQLKKIIWWKLYGDRSQHIDSSFNNRLQQFSNQYRSFTTSVASYGYNNTSFRQNNQQRPENYQSLSYSFNFQSKNRAYSTTQYQNANYNQFRNQSTFENAGEYQQYHASFQQQSAAEQKQIIDDSSENQSQVDQKNAYDSSNAKNYQLNQNQNIYRSFQSQSDYQSTSINDYQANQSRSKYQNQQRQSYQNFSIDNREYRSQYVYNEKSYEQKNYYLNDFEPSKKQKTSVFYFESIDKSKSEHNQSKTIDAEKEFSHDSYSSIFFIGISKVDKLKRTCQQCENKFYFNNKLHKHTRNQHNRKNNKFKSIELAAEIVLTVVDNLSIIRSTATVSQQSSNYAFKTWQYVTVMIKLDQLLIVIKVCLNIGCIMSIINRKFLLKQLSNCKIHSVSFLIIVRDIEVTQHSFSNYIKLKLWISEQNFNDSTMTFIIREIHIVDELRANMFIDMNIQISEKMIINIFRKTLIVVSCFEFFAFIEIISQKKRIDRIVRNRQQLSLSFFFVINVSMQIRDNATLSIDRDYMFHLKASFDFDSKNDVFIYIVDVNINMIQIRNATHKTIIIFRHVKLKRVMNYEKKDCYLTLSNDAHLTIKSKKQIFKNLFKLALANLVTIVMYIDMIQQWSFSIITTKIVTTNIFDVQHIIVIIVSEAKSFLSIMKTIFFRKIIIYENEVIRVKLKTIIDRFSKLWIDREQIINISKNEWMSIDIISNSKILLIKSYSLN